jgi:hypothetical protein
MMMMCEDVGEVGDLTGWQWSGSGLLYLIV